VFATDEDDNDGRKLNNEEIAKEFEEQDGEYKLIIILLQLLIIAALLEYQSSIIFIKQLPDIYLLYLSNSLIIFV
jgi:hypothetical protein